MSPTPGDITIYLSYCVWILQKRLAVFAALRFALTQIARARNYRQPWILRKVRIRRGKLAHHKHRSPLRLNAPRMQAIQAQSRRNSCRAGIGPRSHAASITHHVHATPIPVRVAAQTAAPYPPRCQREERKQNQRPHAPLSSNSISGAGSLSPSRATQTYKVGSKNMLSSRAPTSPPTITMANGRCESRSEER